MFHVVNYTQFIFICTVLASKIKSDPELGIEYFRHDFKKSIKEISTYFRYWNHDWTKVREKKWKCAKYICYIYLKIPYNVNLHQLNLNASINCNIDQSPSFFWPSWDDLNLINCITVLLVETMNYSYVSFHRDMAYKHSQQCFNYEHNLHQTLLRRMLQPLLWLHIVAF